MIPYADSYGVAIATILGLSGFSLAANLQAQIRRGGFASVYAGVLGGTVLWGVLTLGLPTAPIDLPASLLAATAGVGAGWALSELDPILVRRLHRRETVRRPTVSGDMLPDVMARPSRATGDRRDLGRRAAVGIGVLEELVYRGLLVQMCLRLTPPALTAAALGATVVFFGLSHVEFGWPHVAAKTLLGAVALCGVLATGTVVFAAAAHGIYNLRLTGLRRHAAAGR